MIVQEILSRQFDPEQFDRILLKLVDQVLEGQRDNPDYQGMVGACVIDPDGRQACSTSIKENNKWVHAERAAINAYESKYGPVGKNHTVITTLSPCCNPISDREGVSCADLLDSKGITRIYAGYQDPTQADRRYSVTDNKDIQALCKKLADTFLDNDQINEISDERLQDYLGRANKYVDSRMNRMAQARDRLNKSYEIYHAENPNKIIDKFEANTPADAQRYYANFIANYESDVDYDLRLRRATGIVESVDAYHGTFQPTLGKFNSLSHFGTLQAAEDRLKAKARREKIKTPGRIYQVTLDIKNPFVAKDFAGVHSATHFAFDLRNQGLISQEEMLAITDLAGEPGQVPTLVKKLRELGFDSIAYKNKYEDKGSTSYVILDPAQVVSVKTVTANKPVSENSTFNTPRRKLDFDKIYGKYLKVTDNNGDPNKEGFSLVTPLNGNSWNWCERPEFKDLVKQKLNDPKFLGDHKYQQIIDAMSGKQFDPAKHLTKENFADGKKPGRKGLAKRVGVDCKQSVSKLRKIAKNSSGERQRMAHWCANMKSGKKK